MDKKIKTIIKVNTIGMFLVGGIYVLEYPNIYFLDLLIHLRYFFLIDCLLFVYHQLKHK